MPNSIVNANLQLTVQDQLTLTGSIGQTMVSRSVASQFVSSSLASFSGYLTLNSTTPVAITPTGTNVYVVYFRLAVGSVMNLSYTPGSGSSTTIELALGNIFLYATSGLDPVIQSNFLKNIIVACANTNTTSTLEYLVAY